MAVPDAGTPLLVVANEVPGTTTTYMIASGPFPIDRGFADACPGDYPAVFDDIAGTEHEEAIRCAAVAWLTQGPSGPDLHAPSGTVAGS